VARLVDGGISGKLATGVQTGPTLWASVASGVGVATHGIAAALEMRADGGGTQAAGFRSWRAAPVWETLHAAGVSSIAVGWPGTACATDWQATVVDPRYAATAATLHTDSDGEAELAEWPLAPRCVHPAALRDALRDLRLHPVELDAHAVGAAPADVLAHAASMHAAATWLIESTPWQFAAVHYGALLAAGGDGAAMLFDAMIARLLLLANNDDGTSADIVIVGSEGLLIAAGPGFAADVLVHGATVADLAASVLARFGLRREDAAGRVLDGVNYATLRTVAAPPMAVVHAGDDAPLVRERLGNLVADAMASGDFAAATALLAPAMVEWPDDHTLAFMLGQCHFYLGDSAAARTIGATLAQAWPDRPWGPMLTGAALMQAGDVDAAQPHLERAAELAGDDPAAALRLGAIAVHLGQLDAAERHYHVALRHPQCAAAARAGLGMARLARGDNAGGEQQLRASLGIDYHAPALHHQLGVLYASQGRFDSAVAALQTALAQQPGNAKAATLLAQVAAEVASTFKATPAA